MRVLFLNRAFPPDVEATGQYLFELAEDLSRDHEVTVLCGLPNFGTLPGRVFPYRCERNGRVRIWRASGTRLPKSVPVARVVNQASFFAMAALAARRLPVADVVVSLTDPPFLGLLALHLKRRWRVPFIYYCEDIYPDVAQAVGMAPGPLAAAFSRVQARILAGADRVVALADDMAARLASKGVEAGRLAVIRNWADTEAVYPIKHENGFRARQALDGNFVAMYSGNFGYAWDLDAVLDAAAILRERADILFLLIGDGSIRARIEMRVREERLSNVRLLPYEPRESLAESLSGADLHLVPLRPGVSGTIVPSKIYGILASGTPMVALAEPGSEAARVVEAHGCGWCGSPGDAASLAESVVSAAQARSCLASMGERGRAAAQRLYGRRRQTRRFAALLESVVAEGAAAVA